MKTPKEKVRTQFGNMNAILIEARSSGGLSGSPVFIRSDIFKHDYENDRWIRPPIQYYLLGLIHGHWDETASDRINMGIAIVSPVAMVEAAIHKSEYETVLENLASVFAQEGK